MKNPIFCIAGLIFLGGCSSLAQNIAKAGDILHSDVQTQNDWHTRLKKVRKAIKANDIEEAEKVKETFFSAHWKAVAMIEIAEAIYQNETERALSMVHEATEMIWLVPESSLRAKALIPLLTFKLRCERNIEESKTIIAQIERTLALIPIKADVFDRNYFDLQKLSKDFMEIKNKYSHLISR